MLFRSYHSQSCETFFTHVPGLKVVVPSSPGDAKGLLKAAIRDEDPVIFLEPKRIYRSIREEIPGDEYTVPLGRAKVALGGHDVSVFAYGPVMPSVLEAAAKAQEEGISVEVVDLRTLVPLDVETVLASVRKTGRVVIVHEAPKTMGYGAEIAALIAEEALDFLEAPIIRVGGFDTPFPYVHENTYLVTPARIVNAIQKVAGY